MKKIIYLWGPVLFFAALLFIVSSLSFSVDEEPFPLFDKVAHISEYAIFAVLLFRALDGTLKGRDFMWIAILTVIITIGYGMIDEFHQSFVPTRTPEINDVVADSLGALLALTAVFIKRRAFRRVSD